MVTYDIELVKNDGCFDWKFTGTDVSVVSGVQRLRSAVVHAIMLREGELDIDVYRDDGSLVYEYTRAKNNSQNREYVKEAIISACKTIGGVTDATVELTTDGNHVWIEKLVLLYQGTEVDLSGI